MEPLFKTSTKYTYDELKRYSKLANWCVDVSGGVAVVVWNICYTILKIRDTGVLTAGDILTRIVVMVCALAVYYAFITFINTRTIKKEYTENKLTSDATAEFEFFEDYYTVKLGENFSKIEYSKLYRIRETKTNFYLLISSKSAQIIVKDNCDEELIKFLQNKAEKIKAENK